MFNLWKKRNLEVQDKDKEIEFLKNQINQLKCSLDRYIKEENNLIQEFTSNLNELEEFKRSIKNIDSLTLSEKCEYFNNNFSLKENLGKYSFRHFVSEKEIELWANSLYKNWAENIKNFYSEKSMYKIFPFDKYNNLNCINTAIDYYCGYGYREMNMLLRKSYEHSIETIPIYMQLCNLLVFEMLSAPRIDEDIITYRFVDDISFQLIMKQQSEKGYFEEYGFMSTSLLNSIKDIGLESYSGTYCVLKLFVKKGSVGVYSSLLAGRKFEHELILLNSGILKPIKKPYIDNSIGKIVLECSYDNKQVSSDF
ncbi:ADP-ribosyltransferase [Parvimonas micra]|uniref:ADP-ribosyltransferase n=1 Tax=Parvimonas micra TaxID=33033 RepID=UPI0022B6E8DE|nr:ADP-ribosyltransferase [Parvimonas micra]WBB32213.1 ADP-ribosyltransferase [Parvimonas micra]WBB33720.1 ADP-ribosyltransferase [Parvimonas micra]WBB35241.1 ADP-ribosyltransferase [Parvimonas micra]